jgi:hypothetical protein
MTLSTRQTQAIMAILGYVGFRIGEQTLSATVYGTAPFTFMVLLFITLITLSIALSLVHMLDDWQYDSTSTNSRAYHRRRWSLWASLAAGLLFGFLPIFLSA